MKRLPDIEPVAIVHVEKREEERLPTPTVLAGRTTPKAIRVIGALTHGCAVMVGLSRMYHSDDHGAADAVFGACASGLRRRDGMVGSAVLTLSS